VTNILLSDGTFTSGKGNFGTYLEGATVSWDGEANFMITTASADSWRVQLVHDLSLTQGTQYTFCYHAKAAGARSINVNIDSGAPDYSSLMGYGRNVALTTAWQSFSHTFTASATDTTARITFNMGQSDLDVQLDNIGVYPGASCGSPL